jgi:hypothetical protein
MELIHEFTFRADVGAPIVPGAGPYGTRMVMSVTGGWAKGDRISGTLTGAGADWVLIGPDGYARLDVRAQVTTDDGAALYLTYTGLLELSGAVLGVMANPDGETTFEDQYFRTTPRIETGDERYAWVNSSMFVARGRLVPGGVEYEVFRVT